MALTRFSPMRRWRWLVFLLGLWLTPSPAQPAVPGDGNTDPAAVALTHFFSAADLSGLPAPGTGTLLFLHHEYNQTKGFLSSAQCDGDLAGETWTIPEDARRDAERRTDEKPKLSRDGWPPFVRFFDLLSESTGRYDGFGQRHPDARAYVVLWPTGYTHDHQRAFVRFSFGPAGHSAGAIYLLATQNGHWIIVHHTLVYYA